MNSSDDRHQSGELSSTEALSTLSLYRAHHFSQRLLTSCNPNQLKCLKNSHTRIWQKSSNSLFTNCCVNCKEIKIRQNLWFNSLNNHLSSKFNVYVLIKL